MNVSDYMSTHIVYLRAGDHVAIARRPMLDFGLNAIPVLDDDGRPVGVVLLRDLVDEKKSGLRVARAPHTIEGGATLDEAARKLAAEDIHHLVVVDPQGVAVGMLSALDVVRGLVGAPANHPQTIRRFVAASSADVQSEHRGA
jgi:CBS domain-containing protein